MTKRVMSRREVVGGTVIAGAGLAVGAATGAGVASATESEAKIRREQFSFEVACLGDTMREIRFEAPGVDAGDRRGSPFAVEGWIYPEGHIPGDGFIPTEQGSIGRWFCSGWTIISPERPEPHTNARAMFVLGSITDDDLFPEDLICGSEIAGTFHVDQVSTEPITGGTGRYFGVTGQTRRHNISKNTTTLFAVGVQAPNFRYDFDLLYLV